MFIKQFSAEKFPKTSRIRIGNGENAEIYRIL